MFLELLQNVELIPHFEVNKKIIFFHSCSFYTLRRNRDEPWSESEKKAALAPEMR